MTGRLSNKKNNMQITNFLKELSYLLKGLKINLNADEEAMGYK